MLRRISFAFLLASCVLAATANPDGPPLAARPPGLDAYMPVPEDNPPTSAKIALGRKLFFDPQLSRDGNVSCSSCHDPQRAFADTASRSQGAFGRKGKRNAPSLVNRGYGKNHFWDGRASSLEEQVLLPIQDPDEMDLTLHELSLLLQRHPEYRAEFQAVFGRVAHSEDIARALASYLRTVLAGDTRVDRFQSGDRDALTPLEQRGMSVFRGKGNCTACHIGPTFSDESFHNTGVAWRGGELLDTGRFAVTGRERDRGAFKTPTLREVARTAPYMHDGSVPTLADVVEFYDRGGDPNPWLDAEVKPLRLTPDEKAALLAFLRALSGAVMENGSLVPAD